MFLTETAIRSSFVSNSGRPYQMKCKWPLIQFEGRGIQRPFSPVRNHSFDYCFEQKCMALELRSYNFFVTACPYKICGTGFILSYLFGILRFHLSSMDSTTSAKLANVRMQAGPSTQYPLDTHLMPTEIQKAYQSRVAVLSYHLATKGYYPMLHFWHFISGSSFPVTVIVYACNHGSKRSYSTWRTQRYSESLGVEQVLLCSDIDFDSESPLHVLESRPMEPHFGGQTWW